MIHGALALALLSFAAPQDDAIEREWRTRAEALAPQVSLALHDATPWPERARRLEVLRRRLEVGGSVPDEVVGTLLRATADPRGDVRARALAWSLASALARNHARGS